MFALSTAILFLFSFAVRLPNGSSLEEVSIIDEIGMEEKLQSDGSLNKSCSPYETECLFGCCPYAEGVCCIDGFECCQHGQVCIPIFGICVGVQNENDATSLVSTKSTPVNSLSIPCPPWTTTCGPDRCCIFEDATCCSDGEHCCPKGYACDIPHKKCIKNSYNNVVDRKRNFNRYTTEAEDTPLSKLNDKPSYKSCPGGGRVCPSYMSCCINDNAEWSCCPKPSLQQLKYEMHINRNLPESFKQPFSVRGAPRTKNGGDCCTSLTGWVCCPEYSFCTFFGCL